MKKEMQNINRRMISRLMLKVAGLVIMGAVLNSVVMPVVSAEEHTEPGKDCELASKGRYNVCVDVPPEGFYTCVKKPGALGGECVCRWGEFEVGWNVIINWDTDGVKDVCELVQGLSGGTKGVLMKAGQAVVSFITALTVMAGLVILVASGYVYMTAGGDASRVQKAKTWMGAAVAGTVLALLGYTLLRLIATNLVTFG